MAKENRYHDDPDKKPLVTIVTLLSLGAITTAALLYFFILREDSKPTIEVPIAVQPQMPPPKPDIVEPVAPVEEIEETVAVEPIPEPETPLPDLYNSDTAVLTEIKELSLDARLLELIMPESLIQRTVRVIVALHEDKLVHDYRPIRSPEGGIKVVAIEEPLNPDVGQRFTLAPDNYARYEKWIAVFESVDKQKLAKLYRRYYPLLQQTYAQHGGKIKEFDTVLTSVIDKSLAVSVDQEAPILVRQKVLYEYYDAKTEKKSDMEKLLIRMGPENAKRFQTAVNQFKQALKQQ